MSPFFVLRHTGMPFEWLEDLGFSPALVRAADELAAGTEAAGKAGSEANADAVAAFTHAYEAERSLLRSRLHATTRRPEVAEAIFLSSPGAYEQMFAGYLAREQVPDTSRFRRVERQAYTYLQRFCGKNETTSTFGPMGYGTVDDGCGLRVLRRPGPRRRALMSRWALECLAKSLARDPGLRQDIPMRRNPQARGHGDVIRVGAHEHRPDEPGWRVWAALEHGEESVAGLAVRLGDEPTALTSAVRPLRACGAVVRGLRFAAESVDGLGELREALARLPGSQPRARWDTVLGEFARDLAAFERAGLDRRRELLATVENRFTALTGESARRGAGATYADRLVLFEEASSWFEVRIGQDLARWIETSVSPALDLSAASGKAVSAAYRRAAATLIGEAGGSLSFPEYSARTHPREELRSVFESAGVTAEAVPSGDFLVAELPAAEQERPDTCYALPDLCLSGASPETVAASPLVVSRVHHHLLLPGWLTTFADNPAKVEEQVLAWVRRAGRPVISLGVSRRNKGFYRFPGPRLVVTADDHENRPGSVAAPEFQVTLRDGEPCLTGPDGQARLLYLPLADLVGYPPLAALAPPAVVHAPVRLPNDSAGPVFAGPAIYQRRRWTADLSPVLAATGPHAFLALRRLVAARGLPRFVFSRTERERKPYLVDLHSPFTVDMLRHVLREDPVCRLEEMVPRPDELWLRDERGRYTAEMRVQFLRGVPAEELPAPEPAAG
jgi:hypothetical protein